MSGPSGAAGVAKGANLIAVQVFSYFPSYQDVLSYTSDQIKGLERVYALRDTYAIAAVNMSLGGGQYTSTCDSSNTGRDQAPSLEWHIGLDAVRETLKQRRT